MAVTEFYAPFAHLPGRIEWCRIHASTHGSFDCCIILGDSTADPATVYVNDDIGEDFMADRFPECTTIRLPAKSLRMQESQHGRRLHCHLNATEGPVRSVDMAFVAEAGKPREQAYGGEGKPVWGSKFTCRGVDLELDCAVHGVVNWADGPEPLAATQGILTVGSYGVLEER